MARKGPSAKGVPIKIVKLGGSVITDKTSDEPVLREGELKRLAHEVVSAGGETIVLHGAGSFGHPGAKKYNLREGLEAPGAVHGAAEVHALVAKLSAMVVAAREARFKRRSPASATSCADASRPGASMSSGTWRW